MQKQKKDLMRMADLYEGFCSNIQHWCNMLYKI